MARYFILTVHNEKSEEYLKDLYKDLSEEQLKQFDIDLSKLGPEYIKNDIFRHIILKKSSSVSYKNLSIEDDGLRFGLDCPIFINEWISYNIIPAVQRLDFNELENLSRSRRDLGEYNLRLLLREHIMKEGKVVDNWTDEYQKRNLEVNPSMEAIEYKLFDYL